MTSHKNFQRWFWASIGITLVGFAIFLYPYGGIKISSLPEYKSSDELPIVPLEEAYPHVLLPKTSLFTTLRELEIPAPTIQAIVDAAKPVQNLSRLRPGIRFQVYFKNDQVKTDTEVVATKNEEQYLTSIHFRFSAIESVVVSRTGEIWKAEKIIEPVDIKVMTYSGVVTSSLWESAQKAKMDPNLISELADIFAWEVDFSREVRENDRWRLTVEQKLVKGQPIGWGAILAAEYENSGTPYQATLFRLNGEEMGYFTPQGASLRKMFLKSPMRFGRITSGFSRKRFHPVLKTNRAHNGVDYAAPVGTPVRAVGDGTITHASWSGGGGNVIKLRHNSTYQTAYKHLSGYAKGIRSGTKVRQGQVIGYSGNTGLSTGPHLHFEFYFNGSYVDPLRKKFPSADPVPVANLEQFKAESEIFLSGLPRWEEADINTAEMASEATKNN